MMRVLIAYERSGVVRRAFRAAGHEAYSCDLAPADDGSADHIQADAEHVRDYPQRTIGHLAGVLTHGWDLVIAHPPCTYLSVSGQHWNGRRPGRQALTDAALAVVARWFDWAERTGTPLALENPVGIIATQLRPATQYIQPYQFGHDASKTTGLWLVGLPPLVVPDPSTWYPPRIVNGRKRWGNQTDSGQNRLPPSPTRAAKRAETYSGIAAAMAAQWGGGSTWPAR